jgi:hypothetical protein
MAARVPDEMVHAFAAVGRHDQIAAAIEKRFGGLVDSIAIERDSTTSPDLMRELLQDIQRIPRRFRSD